MSTSTVCERHPRKEYVTPRDLYTWHVGGFSEQAGLCVRDALAQAGVAECEWFDRSRTMAAYLADAERSCRAQEAWYAAHPDAADSD
jgi:hypothetical protein